MLKNIHYFTIIIILIIIIIIKLDENIKTENYLRDVNNLKNGRRTIRALVKEKLIKNLSLKKKPKILSTDADQLPRK